MSFPPNLALSYNLTLHRVEEVMRIIFRKFPLLNLRGNSVPFWRHSDT